MSTHSSYNHPPLALPEYLHSERLTLRVPSLRDAGALNALIQESFDNLSQWLPWARSRPSVDDTSTYISGALEAVARKEKLPLLIFLRDTGELIGSSGFHAIDWSVPRMEIGYWLANRFVGHGYMVEAVCAQTDFAFSVLGARRIEIRMDNLNERSWKVAERSGYSLDGILRSHSRGPAGELRDDRVYSQIR